MRLLRWMPAVLLAFGLAACSSNDEGDGGLAESERKLISLFDPVAASAVIPFPNDGLFGTPTDGTLNIPNPSNAPFVTAANHLDGFSTVASAFTDLIGAVDLDSANTPGAIVIINTRTFQTLVPGVDYRVQFSTAVDPVTGRPLDELRSRLLIEPLKPLAPATTYLVVVTRALKSVEGVAAEPADLFRVLLSDQSVTAQLVAGNEPALTLLSEAQRNSLEGIRQLYQTRILPPLAAAGLPAQALVIAWPFTTQSIGPTLRRLQNTVQPQLMTLVATGLTTQDVIPALPPVADLYVGSIELPYYLADATPTQDDADESFFVNGAPDNPLNSYWRADAGVVADGNAPIGAPCAALQPSVSTTRCFPQPRARASQRVPVLATIPNANSGRTAPEGGWPVVIFQHGITGNRSQMLAIAPALAAAGFAVVAIDLPLHGLPPGDALRAATEQFPQPLRPSERTFDLDLVDNSTGAPPADGVPDASGTHFINLSSLLTSRDNVRQAEADLITLAASVGGAVILGGNLQPSGARFADGDVRYVGYSLGAIVATTFLGVNPGNAPAVLAMPGGGIAKLLDGSASFGPRIAAGLSAASGGSIAEGNDTYETFLRFAQQVIDDGDPLNYAAAASANRSMLMFVVRGDAVVPNCTIRGDANCPATDTIPISSFLGGSDPLARALGLAPQPGPALSDGFDVPIAAQTIVDANGIDAVVRFNQGDHGSILSPAANALVTCEMQTQTAFFLASGGRQLPIGNCASTQ
jgi:pimeloyl-ACP methyl ester carboxylesterase